MGLDANRLWSDACSWDEKGLHLLLITDARGIYLQQLYLDCSFLEQTQNSIAPELPEITCQTT